jgi:hypothetical protein
MTQEELDAALAAQPCPVLICIASRDFPTVPADYVERHRFHVDGRMVAIYCQTRNSRVTSLLPLRLSQVYLREMKPDARGLSGR